MWWCIASGMLLLLGVASTALGHEWVDWRVRSLPTEEERRRYSTPLHDEIHARCPDLSQYRWIADGSITVYQFCALVVWPVRVNLLVSALGVVYTVRAVCFCATLLPRCHLHIEPPKADVKPCLGWVGRFWRQLMRVEHRTRFGHGHDLVFSGHTAMIVTICAHWSAFLHPLPFAYLPQLYWGAAVMVSFTIVVTRCHYTIDVLLAWLCSLFLHQTIAQSTLATIL